MDEPFSALDVLTAENLRNEINGMWQPGVFPAERQFATAVDWGRHAELFEYDAQERGLTITPETKDRR